MNYANIESHLVVTIIVADPAFIATLPGLWIDVTNIDCGIGWTYFNGVFTPPTAPVPPYDPEQGYQQYIAMMLRRADKLEADGDIVAALILRESLK